MSVGADVTRRVALRAAGRCEYCQMHQSLQGATFHVEHVIPTSRGGSSQLDNLAWACPGCNLRKSDRVEVPAPGDTGNVTLFNPRTDTWHGHFRWDGYQITGLTSIGQATVAALDLNHERRIRIRAAEEFFWLFPP